MGLAAPLQARNNQVRHNTWAVDLLWAVEESLRTAPVGLVIAEPSKPTIPLINPHSALKYAAKC